MRSATHCHRSLQTPYALHVGEEAGQHGGWTTVLMTGTYSSPCKHFRVASFVEEDLKEEISLKVDAPVEGQNSETKRER